MASGEFICKNCKQVTGTTLFSNSGRYKCPEHGFICKNCITKGGLFKDTKCNVCSSKVVSYEWTGKKWSSV